MENKITVLIDPELQGLTDIKGGEMTHEQFFQVMHDILGND